MCLVMCDENNLDFGCADDKNAFNEDISHKFDNVLQDLPEVMAFILKLQDCILRHRGIIVKLFEKIKNQNVEVVEVSSSKNVCDASTQTSIDDLDWATDCSVGESAAGGNIVDIVKEIAESAVRQTGFVYEANSGMYYDYNTGYYYNAELGLYYDGNSGTYYKYDETTKTFSFHSTIDSSTTQKSTDCSNILCKNDEESSANKITEHLENDDEKSKMDLEEGEYSDESDGSDSKVNDGPIQKDDNLNKDVIVRPKKLLIDLDSDIKEDELANGWPPCMRVIVQETGLDNLATGTLFIVTCNGGTLGREGDHSVTIPDITISKHHAIFKFSEERNQYTIVDLGSRNGTFLNGNRLSVALQESPPHMIEHGSVLRVGSTHLLCHIHSGHDTCKQCEPGCLVKSDKDEAVNERKQIRHRTELRRLRRKFGLEGPGSGIKLANSNSNYQDRADVRRKTVGSSDDNVKTEVASVFTSIKSNNKGFKMMSKMGWSEGQTLGKDSHSENAITEPIIVEQRPDKMGLGCSERAVVDDSSTSKRKNTIWKKTQKRYKELAE